MSEVFPISCISCRRKKIKCNKVKPCNQCERRNICCNFPPTFRNIKINEDELNNKQSSLRRSHSSSTVSGESSSAKSDSEASSEKAPYSDSSKRQSLLAEEVYQLKAEKDRIAQEHTSLKKKYQSLLSQVSNHGNEQGGESMGSFKKKDPISISGETSELGGKYYGPQSSDYMMKNIVGNDKRSSDKPVSGSKSLRLKPGGPGSSELEGSCTDLSATDDYIRNSLLKKPLPYLLDIGDDLKPHRDPDNDLNKLNFSIICKLVDYFFSFHPYYKTFISRTQIMNFLNNYEYMNNNEWENDDDLLLLVMVLLMLIQRLTAKEFVEINLLGSSNNQIQKFKQARNYLSDILFHRFEKLRHNLINEAITTIQSYILCTEWHFIEQKYEESWSMMFHTCSIAYSIGVHVMGKYGLMDEQPLKEKDHEFARYKVWFALKNISGQICSVLGRPNPISVNVNSPMLQATNPNQSSLNLYKYKMLILLKTGLSECLKLSNMMLIENFMIEFAMKDLLELDTKFKEDIGLLKWFINEKLYVSEILLSDGKNDANEDLMFDDIDTDQPKVDKANLLVDLITFYINRAKLFQPFVSKFEDEKDSNLVIELLYDSIVKFLDCTVFFINSYLKYFGERYKEDEFKYIRVATFGKLLRSYYPFLNSFIYQGMIVILTFLHFKFKSFVEYKDSLDSKGINYSQILNELENKLSTLHKLQHNFARMTANRNKLWSSNITNMISLILKRVGKVHQSRNVKIEIDNQNFENDLNELNNQINLGHIVESDFHGFNFRDPFWITNPDNLPYHLSSPSDDDDRPSYNLDIGSQSKNDLKSGKKSKHVADQPLDIGEDSTNILIDNFDSQTASPFENIWNNTSESFPSKSTSLTSQPYNQDPSIMQQESRSSGSYPFRDSEQSLDPFNLEKEPNQMLREVLDSSKYSSGSQEYPPDVTHEENTTMEDDTAGFNPDML